MPGIARKGDQDDLGYTITGELSDNVRVNGIQVALKGSTMNDGVTIIDGCSTTVRVNGVVVAVKGSQTEKHPKENQIGTIQQGSPDVNIE